MADIRALRVAAGLTQAELAERAGTARPNIAAYESGAKTPSPEVRDRLIAAMRPRPSDALRGHEADVLLIATRNGATRVRVFGSVATGSDTIDSDLDLLVDLAPATSLFDLFQMEDEIADLLGVEVEVVSARTASDEMIASAIDLRPSSAA
ncbi:MAG: helix-turn-helix domain-containing protein [Pseudolysinimonas sp.]|uniref:helix-turn-helix domain-containing protein n=1 Tax=Pseudolysinimonas sp. TaxID=2680009 RepID=UPI003264659B